MAEAKNSLLKKSGRIILISCHLILQSTVYPSMVDIQPVSVIVLQIFNQIPLRGKCIQQNRAYEGRWRISTRRLASHIHYPGTTDSSFISRSSFLKAWGVATGYGDQYRITARYMQRCFVHYGRAIHPTSIHKHGAKNSMHASNRTSRSDRPPFPWVVQITNVGNIPVVWLAWWI